MKCVKHIRTDEVKRVNDERAHLLVQGGTWTYTNKQEWKEKTRDAKAYCLCNSPAGLGVEEV